MSKKFNTIIAYYVHGFRDDELPRPTNLLHTRDCVEGVLENIENLSMKKRI